MNKKIISIVVIVIIIIIVLVFKFMFQERERKNLASPGSLVNGKQVEVLPSSSPSPTPKTFKFDEKTDLKSELETVNPEVKESDFE